MKKLQYNISVILVFLALSCPSLAQTTALKESPKSILDLPFSSSVQMSNNNKKYELSGDEAKNKISSLLNSSLIQDLEAVHEGYSYDKSSYYGIVQVKNKSTNSRVFYYCKNIDGEYKVTKIRMNQR